MRKPSGTAGPVQITIGADGQPQIEHLKIVWPDQKTEIERKVCAYFRRECPRVNETVLDVEHSGENDLDFLLILPTGKTWLELMWQFKRAHYPVGWFICDIWQKKIGRKGAFRQRETRWKVGAEPGRSGATLSAWSVAPSNSHFANLLHRGLRTEAVHAHEWKRN